MALIDHIWFAALTRHLNDAGTDNLINLTVNVAGTYDSQWAMWDNVRLLSPSGYVSGGTLTSSAIAPASPDT